MQDGEVEAWLMARRFQAQGGREGWSWLGQERGRVQAVELSEGKEDNWSLVHDFGKGRSGADSVLMGGQKLKHWLTGESEEAEAVGDEREGVSHS